MSAIRQRNITKFETNDMIEQEVNKVGTERKKKLLFRRLTVFFLSATVVSFFMISTLMTQSAVLENKITEKNKLVKELNSLEKQELLLKEEIVKLNDEEYLAKLARKDYFLSDKGEIIFNIPKEKDN